VRLPLEAEESAAVEMPPVHEKRRTAPAFDPLQSAHLLLVEDHVDTAAVLARMLRRAGYQVTVATSVAQGLAETEAASKTADDRGRFSPIRLVISDLGLPDGSGMELMSKLAARFRLSGIALSGFGMEDDVARALAAGFTKHLTKPVDFDLLLSTIRELLAR
jgi:DNA-binding response OmpR family regulator